MGFNDILGHLANSHNKLFSPTSQAQFLMVQCSMAGAEGRLLDGTGLDSYVESINGSQMH